MKIIWGLVLLLSTVLTMGTSLRENYCERNVTVRSVQPVTKQRTIVKPPSKWKFWKKPEKKTEFYNAEEEQVTYKLVSECCQGFIQVESGLCEPVCDRGCPAHASCVAPQRCQCISGYISALNHQDGTHYCEPICERGCASGSQCVSPNTCACREGYQQLAPSGDGVSGDCVPTCQLGDGCSNGKCVDVERCSCNPGYLWDKEEDRCTEVSAESIADELETTEYSAMEAATATATATAATDCPEDFILFRGECREKQFNSNESGCLQGGCGPHQTCNESGLCQCADGYVPEEGADQNANLSCRRTLLDQILSLDAATDDEDELNPWTIPIIGVASGALFVLLLVGLLGGMRHRQRRSGPNPKPKEGELQCQFSQKSYDVDEWVP
ncbi:GL21258 [Drosophila persimilis]|uniref:GL21258 n=1 Tax=Drosophila persimilis TaxID=7234 RepID=B4GX54_DROPE|nr:multiple epidermal growth factor-like domains protein 10 [Drosophila persimilis]EDW27381.1 GL21258 [Drosophila persimilis]